MVRTTVYSYDKTSKEEVFVKSVSAMNSLDIDVDSLIEGIDEHSLAVYGDKSKYGIKVCHDWWEEIPHHSEREVEL